MNPSWEALNARAHGLATRLLGRRQIEELAAGADLSSLADRLVALRLARADSAATAASLEREVEGAAAERIRRLRPWAGDVDALAIVFESEDRRCLRRMLRGAAQAASPGARLAALLPTASLPLAVLRDLAAQPTPTAVVARLVGRRHPLAAPMGAAVERGKTDLFHLELALDRAFAERIRRCARWAPRDLRRHVGSSIDLENVSSALLAGAYAANDTALFLAGGERLGRERFLAAIRAGEIKKRRRILAAAFAGTAVATNLMDDKVELARLEARFLRARIAEQTRAARIDPLGPTPFLAYALRLRGETHDLLRVIWGTASGMPRTLIAEGLATP